MDETLLAPGTVVEWNCAAEAKKLIAIICFYVGDSSKYYRVRVVGQKGAWDARASQLTPVRLAS